MKICSTCATQNKNSALFCEKCGASLADVAETAPDVVGAAGDLLNKAGGLFSTGAKKAKEAAAGAQKAASENMAKAQEQRQEKAARRAEAAKKDAVFVDQSETAIATLGTNFAQNVLAGGKVKQGSAILTEKRLYYKGDLFSGSGKSLMSIKGEYIVPVEDISMTSFVHGEHTGGKLFGLLLLVVGAALFFLFAPAGVVAALAGIVFLIKGFLGKSTVFEISFPGGRFRFDVKWYPISDMQDFQRQIHLVKDHYAKQ